MTPPKGFRAKPKIPIAGLKPLMRINAIAISPRKTQNPDRGTETKDERLPQLPLGTRKTQNPDRGTETTNKVVRLPLLK